MAIIKDSQELERYLYEKSSKNLALYLKVNFGIIINL